LNIIKNDKKINSYSYNKKDTICILFNDRITKYYLANGEKLNEKIFDKDTLGEFYYFIGEKTYYKDNKDEYKSMYLEDSINFFIYTKAGNILELNNDFSINKILSVKDIFNLRYKINDYKILTNGSKLLVISNAGKAVVEVKATKNIIKKQKTLLDVKENNLIIINLKNVIDN
jgi:hypothetical protein